MTCHPGHVAFSRSVSQLAGLQRGRGSPTAATMQEMTPLVLLAVGFAVRQAFSAAPKWIPQVAGPFRVIPTAIEECPAEMMPKREYSRYKVTMRRDRKHPDVWFFSSNITTFITCDDNLTATLNMASWKSTGGWADGAHDFKVEKPCTTVKTHFPSYWKMAMQALFQDETRECPFPPGNYSFANFSSDLDFKVPPSWFYGKYRCTFAFWHPTRKERVVCVRIYGAVVPKRIRAT